MYYLKIRSLTAKLKKEYTDGCNVTMGQFNELISEAEESGYESNCIYKLDGSVEIKLHYNRNHKYTLNDSITGTLEKMDFGPSPLERIIPVMNNFKNALDSFYRIRRGSSLDPRLYKGCYAAGIDIAEKADESAFLALMRKGVDTKRPYSMKDIKFPKNRC